MPSALYTKLPIQRLYLVNLIHMQNKEKTNFKIYQYINNIKVKSTISITTITM